MPEETTQKPTSIEEIQPKMILQGTITRTELYGAFVDVGLNRNGLMHISRLATGRVKKVTDVVNVGDEVSVWVQSVDHDRGRIALTIIEPPDVEWHELEAGQVFKGQVVCMERYGVFVDIGAERPGLLHVREMGTFVRNPEEITRMGQTIQVTIRSVDQRKHQIDFTLNSGQSEPDVLEDEEPGASPMEIAFLQARELAQADGRRFRERPSRKRRGRGSDNEDMEDIYRRTLGG